jgi:hypothetical protein
MTLTNGERTIANCLSKAGINFTYNHPMFIWREGKLPAIWCPDFYLHDFGIVIEFYGRADSDSKYEANSIRKTKVYNMNKVNLIRVYPRHIHRINDYLLPEIKKILDKNVRNFENSAKKCL